jgi:hypothetical protein
VQLATLPSRAMMTQFIIRAAAGAAAEKVKRQKAAAVARGFISISVFIRIDYF